MAARKKPVLEYELYFLNVKEFHVHFHSGLNYKAVESANTYHDEVPVFSHYPDIRFECECFYPEKMDGIAFHVTIHGSDEDKHKLVSDYAEKDEMGRPKYAKRRGQPYQVHNLPKGIGSLEKVRGENEWRAYCFVDSAAVATMVSVLNLKVPLYLSLDTVKQQRYRAVRAVDLQTEKPE